jgi:quercetin dioxygenase-like cupin family protein/uncharacterized protein YgiM (DUF1202 family)
MQRALATDIDHTSGLRAMPFLFIAIGISLLMALSPAASAQEATPAATPDVPAAAETGALGEVLVSYDVAEMPRAPMTVRMLRITLAPGASVPMHTHPGVEFDYVESGTLTARPDGTMVTSVDGTETETSETQDLGVGSWVMFPEGTGMNLANDGEDDVVLLSAVVLSVGNDIETTITYTEAEPTDADFEGVSFVVLGDGLIQQFPEGSATITIDELTLGAGEPVSGFTGVAMLSKESGSFAFASTEGAVQVTRTASPQLQPNAIPGQEFELNDNDAAFFPAGYASFDRAESQDELVLVRLLIEPEGELASSPAVVTALATETAATDEGEPVTGDGIGVGAIIALNTETVNIRSEASTDSEIVDTFPAGTQFELTDGPVEGEEYTWYAVQGVGDLSTVEGWLVTDFMDVIEPAPEGAEQVDGDGSAGTQDEEDEVEEPAATPDEVEETDATPDEIEVGTIVTLTQDNVRVREEPNTGAFIINVFEAGTEMEVLDGPQVADGFTWYQVQLIDTDIVGWTAVDFLEAAEPAE